MPLPVVLPSRLAGSPLGMARFQKLFRVKLLHALCAQKKSMLKGTAQVPPDSHMSVAVTTALVSALTPTSSSLALALELYRYYCNLMRALSLFIS